MRRREFLKTCAVAGASAIAGAAEDAVITFNDDGGWCWFQDERAIVDAGKLIIGSVASGWRDPKRRGAIECVAYDLRSGAKSRVTLNPSLVAWSKGKAIYDDHNAPAFLARPDGRILAVYAKHGDENRFYYRISSELHNPLSWRPEESFTPSQKSRITYSNLHLLSRENGRIYNFYRGLDDSFKPSYAWSDDGGETWKSGIVFIDVPAQFRHRPYVKYASNGIDTIHIFYTEGHPRNFNNSVYHVFYRNGKLHKSDGTVIRALSEGLNDPTEGTRIFRGDAQNIAWTSDIAIDRSGRPYAAFSVHKSAEDHRYHYARWTGTEWADYEIAHAGTCLYPAEDHYTGNIALDPHDPATVYISADVDPVSGKPLISKADGKRHYEIFRGRTRDRGVAWSWTPVTRDSASDNLRPIMPKWDSGSAALLWLRGAYRTYTDFDLSVVGKIFRRA